MHRAVQSRGHYTDQASTLQRCFEIPKILLFISPPVQSICCFKPTKKTDFEHLWTAASKGWTLLVVHCKCVTGWVCSCHRIDLWLSQHWAHIFLVSSSTFRCCTVSDPISWNHSDYIRNNATVYWYGPPASQPPKSSLTATTSRTTNWAVRYPPNALCSHMGMNMEWLVEVVALHAAYVSDRELQPRPVDYKDDRATDKSSLLLPSQDIYDSNLHCGPGDVIYSLRTDAATVVGYYHYTK